jgi:hypothetical protein
MVFSINCENVQNISSINKANRFHFNVTACSIALWLALLRLVQLHFGFSRPRVFLNDSAFGHEFNELLIIDCFRKTGGIDVRIPLFVHLKPSLLTTSRLLLTFAPFCLMFFDLQNAG